MVECCQIMYKFEYDVLKIFYIVYDNYKKLLDVYV